MTVIDNNMYLIYNELAKRIFEIKKSTLNLSLLNSEENNHNKINDAVLKMFIEEYFNIYEDMSYIAYAIGGDFYNMVLDLQRDSINNLINRYPDKAKQYKYIHRIIKSK